ncbi:hypothetical protein [Nitrospira sp. M1]
MLYADKKLGVLSSVCLALVLSHNVREAFAFGWIDSSPLDGLGNVPDTVGQPGGLVLYVCQREIDTAIGNIALTFKVKLYARDLSGMRQCEARLA